MGNPSHQHLRDSQLPLAAFVFVRLDPAHSALRHAARSRRDSSAVARELSPLFARTRLHTKRCDTDPNPSTTYTGRLPVKNGAMNGLVRDPAPDGGKIAARTPGG